MKTLILKSGAEVPILGCYGQGQYIQGAQRDVLDIRLDPETYTLDQVDQLFTAEECAKLRIRETVSTEQQVIGDDGTPLMDEEGKPVTETVESTNEYIHENYVLRVALCKQTYTVADADGQRDEAQISVQMAQKTAAEIRVDELSDAVDALILDSLT